MCVPKGMPRSVPDLGGHAGFIPHYVHAETGLVPMDCTRRVPLGSLSGLPERAP